ncbi:outer membrane protein assembly factor BamB [Paenibacillus sp. W4I10]|uniref:outer membrane protein assembly factor BamB family protein n=1 Tax=Paenibacillus sp. W4I10 TaxID=3042298 RepID=UPI00277E87C4|nr:PQQ-binding-like beta-propeller repeat protein [Paenibacillus sp. W4I10]MDQ0720605.1 outer membrane protein assembly factor BamB [Paenibacillus sp. W4I10]
MINRHKRHTMKHIKRRAGRPIVAGLTAGILMVHGVIGVLPSQVHAEASDVSIRNWYSYQRITVPELKPTWTAKVDNHLNMNETYIGANAIAEEGKVFTFAGSKLVALDATTGKRLWTYGKELTPYITYQGGVLYGLTSDHKPYALNAKTGKAKWQSGTSTWIDTVQRTEVLIPTVDTLYVIKGSTTFALDMQSGKLRWKADEPLGEGHGTEYLEESNGIVLRTFFVQGALTSVQLNAYDKKTGKKLWGHFGQGEGIQIKDGLVYSVDFYSPMLEDDESSPERKWKVNAYNLKTGVLKGSQEYRWTMPGDPPYMNGRGGILVNKDKLYIAQGDNIAEYSLNTTKSATTPIRTFHQPYGDKMELLGIVQQRLVYKNLETGELKGIKLANGQEVQWHGDAPVSQIDVYGKGMYRAQRNGTLLALNMMTGQPAFRVATGGDLHNTTLKTNGMIIIQAEGKLLGVKLPASLK